MRKLTFTLALILSALRMTGSESLEGFLWATNGA